VPAQTPGDSSNAVDLSWEPDEMGALDRLGLAVTVSSSALEDAVANNGYCGRAGRRKLTQKVPPAYPEFVD
jgi:hypothetical protein